MDDVARWFDRPRRVPSPAGRVVCLAHAGGGVASFRGWDAHLPAAVELWSCRYPGRDERLDEPMPGRMDGLVTPIVEALLEDAPVPTVVLGHSLGAVVAYEVARRLDARGHAPRLLVVSGRPAPHRDRRTHLHLQPDAALWADVDRLGAGGAGGHPELRRLLAPTLRADYRLSETYRGPEDPPALRCDILAVLGDRDPEVTADEAGSWARAGGRDTTTLVVPGDHFALFAHAARVLDESTRRLLPVHAGAR